MPLAIHQSRQPLTFRAVPPHDEGADATTFDVDRRDGQSATPHLHAQAIPDGVITTAGPDGPDAVRVCAEHRWQSASVPANVHPAIVPPFCPVCVGHDDAVEGQRRFARCYGA